MARTMLTCRVSDAGVAAVAQLAAQAGVTRSEMVRRLLSVALADPTIRRKAVKP